MENLHISTRVKLQSPTTTCFSIGLTNSYWCKLCQRQGYIKKDILHNRAKKLKPCEHLWTLHNH